jgi:hypothetical protein
MESNLSKLLPEREKKSLFARVIAPQWLKLRTTTKRALIHYYPTMSKGFKRDLTLP